MKTPFGLGITAVGSSRDPDFATKAGRVLDLYARQWQGRALKDDEFVISADEKTSIQARRRKHTTHACRPRTPMHVAWTYIAGLDMHQPRVFGRCKERNGIEPFGRLVEQVMTRPPYNQARRVFWIVDNCSAHRGAPKPRNAYTTCIPASNSSTPPFMPVG